MRLLALAGGVALVFQVAQVPRPAEPTNAQIVEAFGKQGMRINAAEAAGIRANVLLALKEARAQGIGNSKVDFAAVEIARDLGLDTSPGSNTVKNVVAALRYLHERSPAPTAVTRPEPPRPSPVEWDRYFDETVNLWNQQDFLALVKEKQFHPVKISWEDIGRHENSVWGDRISDVGIWVRKVESDPRTAKLALSVRRDSNFRDKILVVPSEKIKVHQRISGKTVEKTLPQRLAELGLTSAARDRNVIVSNQFAIAPVPSRQMHGAWPSGVPPRAAFTFSIFPYGSTNMVITDVIEGSHEAIVGRGGHQLLFANVDGQKAPFTASRAEDRPDLLRLEKELRAPGHGRGRPEVLPDPGAAPKGRARDRPVEHGAPADATAADHRDAAGSSGGRRRTGRRPAAHGNPASAAPPQADGSAARGARPGPPPQDREGRGQGRPDPRCDRPRRARRSLLHRHWLQGDAGGGADPGHRRLLRHADRPRDAEGHGGFRRRLRAVGRRGHLGRQLRDEGIGNDDYARRRLAAGP